MTELEWKCLWLISDDYEEIPHIRQFLKDNAAMEVSAQEVSASIQKLVSFGFAAAYRFDESKQEYVKADHDGASLTTTWVPGESTIGRFWYYITKAGVEELKGKASPWVTD